MKCNSGTPIYSFKLNKIQTSKGRSFQLALCQTPAFRSAHPHQMNGWVAHTSQCLFGFKHLTKGEYKAFCIGGVLPKEKALEWKLRMKVGFHHKNCSERVDGSLTIKIGLTSKFHSFLQHLPFFIPRTFILD